MVEIFGGEVVWSRGILERSLGGDFAKGMSRGKCLDLGAFLHQDFCVLVAVLYQFHSFSLCHVGIK